MAEIGKGILDGFKSVGDIASRKARLVQLGSQAKAAKQRIGQAAYEQGIECGPASQAARETHDVLEKAAERSAVAAEAMKSATGVKAKAMATKDAATATAARKLAESKVRAAHETLGDHVLLNNIAVPGMQAEITNAQALVEQIRSLNVEVGGLGRGLMGNKIGLAVVACTALPVVIVVIGLGWYMVSGTGAGRRASGGAEFIEKVIGVYGGNGLSWQGDTIEKMAVFDLFIGHLSPPAGCKTYEIVPTFADADGYEIDRNALYPQLDRFFAAVGEPDKRLRDFEYDDCEIWVYRLSDGEARMRMFFDGSSRATIGSPGIEFFGNTGEHVSKEAFK